MTFKGYNSKRRNMLMKFIQDMVSLLILFFIKHPIEMYCKRILSFKVSLFRVSS